MVWFVFFLLVCCVMVSWWWWWLILFIWWMFLILGRWIWLVLIGVCVWWILLLCCGCSGWNFWFWWVGIWLVVSRLVKNCCCCRLSCCGGINFILLFCVGRLVIGKIFMILWNLFGIRCCCSGNLVMWFLLKLFGCWIIWIMWWLLLVIIVGVWGWRKGKWSMLVMNNSWWCYCW